MDLENNIKTHKEKGREVVRKREKRRERDKSNLNHFKSIDFKAIDMLTMSLLYATNT